MTIYLRHIGAHGCFPASILELNISDGSFSIETTVTKLNGEVEDGLIDRLETLVEELKEHNDKVKQSKK